MTRRLLASRHRLAAGQRVGIEPGRYTGDPRTALGLQFVSEPVATSLGAMPAWFVPGRRRTWVILVHGLGGSRADVLSPMRILHAAGYPMLAITYRNDTGAPQSPDHHSHLGATEWQDLAAAIVYARRHGALGVVLYGYSMGGAMALVAARDRRLHSDVRALVLDSPVLDWPATLSYDARRHGMPQPFVTLAETVVAWRIGIDWSQFDQLKHERQLEVPVLLFQGSADTVVPASLAGRFARDGRGRITYVRVPGADHVSAIDTDPARYRRLLVRFLARYR